MFMRIRKRGSPPSLAFNVTYEDGMTSWNRLVPRRLLAGCSGDSLYDRARAAIEAQDREIVEHSDNRLYRARVKSVALAE